MKTGWRSALWCAAVAAAAVVSSAGPVQAKKQCEGIYFPDNAHKISTGWIDMGSVGWPERRRKCGKRVGDSCGRAENVVKTRYAPPGSANFYAICAHRGVGVDWAMKVDGLGGGLGWFKDGNCWLHIDCVKDAKGNWWHY